MRRYNPIIQLFLVQFKAIAFDFILIRGNIPSSLFYASKLEHKSGGSKTGGRLPIRSTDLIPKMLKGHSSLPHPYEGDATAFLPFLGPRRAQENISHCRL